jgi:hypothetical protein
VVSGPFAAGRAAGFQGEAGLDFLLDLHGVSNGESETACG